MTNPNYKKPNPASALEKLIVLLAKAIAVTLTFFLFGPIYKVSTPFVGRYVQNVYGVEFFEISVLAWGLLLIVIVFALSALLMMVFSKWLIFKLR